MIRKAFLSVVAALLTLHAVFAQTLPPVKLAVISGTVMDDPYPMKRASMPIPGVRVRLWQQLAIVNPLSGAIISNPGQVLIDSTTTAASGTFALTPIAPGSYQVSFDNPAYVSRQIPVYAQSDTSLTVLLVAAGAHGRVAGTVWAACSGFLGMPCVLQPIARCTVTVSTSTLVPIVPVGLNQAISYPIIPVAYTAITDSLGRYAVDSIPLDVNGERVSVSTAVGGYVAQTIDTAVSNGVTTTVDFSLAKTTAGPRDTVYVTPQNPTAADSLHFTLYNANHCCGTIYRGNAVSVADTIIYLSYTYDDSLCPYIACFAAGSTTGFSSEPLAPGRYAIYKVESLYCPPGRMCPLFLLAPERVGSVTVSSAASVSRAPATFAAEKILGISGNSALVNLASGGRAVLRVFDVGGKLLAELHNGPLTAGLHRFAIGRTATASRMIMVSLTVNGKRYVVKTAAMVR
ncbi:MAG TPA: carboxypeptidase-like regulatory domain-containing protein [Chitinivibrionales bacterium]|nr:carboxypeptidase-like regulatory domain-containing protein [Chitinivibrionales bacterium]